MKIKYIQKLLLAAIIFILTGLVGSSSAAAQTGRTVLISAPEIEQYPIITFYIDPVDRNNNFLQGLSRDQIAINEDGISRELLEFDALQPGIQIVAAFNFSEPFAIQDVNGRSRFYFIRESLLNWAAQPLESSPDDLSLVTNTGQEFAHLQERAEWASALADLSAPLRETESSFNVLARAIELASDPVDQQGMKRAVLFFTPQPSEQDFPAIESLIAQAADNQVQVYPILVNYPEFFESEGAQKLTELSQQTGGRTVTFSGEEPLADVGQLLQPLRSTYLLRYQSSIVTSGTHTLQVTVESSQGDLVGQREFFLDVQPPNPIFISPPRVITRTAEEIEDAGAGEDQFQPASVTLPVLVEFPDGHPRDLEELIFRVDGEIVERRTDPPFEEVRWNLEGFRSSATHYLTLEAVDSVGLSRLGVATPVEIEIQLPPQTVRRVFSRNAPALAGLALILVLGLTLFLMITRGTIRPAERGQAPWIIDQGRRTAGLIREFLSQQNETESTSRPTSIQPYRLIPISDITRQLFAEPININQQEIILGSSQELSEIQISHPSVIPKHTRISIRKDGRYQISDLGSNTGTWINNQQITEPKRHFLKDGDMIHIGEAAFRFQIIPEMRPSEENNS